MLTLISKNKLTIKYLFDPELNKLGFVGLTPPCILHKNRVRIARKRAQLCINENGIFEDLL